MKFLIQKINGKLVHDFSFTLLESIRYNNWLNNNNDTKYQFLNTTEDDLNNTTINFKPSHKNFTPIGSVEFVTKHLYDFYDIVPKPLNVPEELIGFACRTIFNGNEKDCNTDGLFVKSNDTIKKFQPRILERNEKLPVGNYQFSGVIDILSEWRAFVYKDRLVGLNNYSGDFTIFPNVEIINQMIEKFRISECSPIAYTLDVGVNNNDGTFIIEAHDFFSVGLYGFADHKLLPRMFQRWYDEYVFINY